MNTFTRSLTLTVPTAQRDAANRLMAALGRDGAVPPRTFSRACSTDGRGTATHYLSHTYDDELADIITSGKLPRADWSAYGLTEETAQAALDAIEIRAEGGVKARQARANVEAELHRKGLRMIERDERVIEAPR